MVSFFFSTSSVLYRISGYLLFWLMSSMSGLTKARIELPYLDRMALFWRTAGT